MKTVFLFALILTETLGVAHGGSTVRNLRQRPAPPVREGPVATVRVTRTRIPLFTARRRAGAPPPVGAAPIATAPAGRTVEGVLPNLVQADNPLQMINPLAPPEYGSARNFVVYTERDPYRTTNENKYRFQPDGIRLLTVRPLW